MSNEMHRSHSSIPLPAICLIGSGMQIPEQLTLESLDALRQCHEIYSILSPAEQEHLPEEFSPRLKSLWPLYKPGAPRADVYASEVETILEAAARHAPVAYLTPGHPIVFDRVTQGIITAAPTRGLTYKIFPGISSLDTMLVDLQRDIAPGIQIYDATSMVVAHIEPRVDLDCLLFQIAVFGTTYVAAGYQTLPDAFALLQAHLLQFYPPEHEVIQVTSAFQGKPAAHLNHFALQHLSGPECRIQVPSGSLFIPRLRSLTPDPALLAQIRHPSSLENSYRR